MFKKFKESAYWKTAGVMLVCGAILIVFNNWISKATLTSGINAVIKAITPFFIGVIFAFLLCPLYNWIVRNLYARLGGETAADRRRSLSISRVVASVVSLVLVVGIITLIIYAIVPQFVASCVELANTMPERLAALSDWLSVHFSRFPMLAAWVDNIAKGETDAVIRWMQENIIGGDAMTVASAISSGVMSALNFVVDMIIGILIMVYLLNYKERLFAIGRKFIAATCKTKTQDGIFEFSDIINETFIGFIVGRIIDSTIIGILTYVVLLICGISFAPMISVIVGVTNVIPFFGPFIGAIPSFFILMLENPTQGLWFVVIIVIIQQLDGNVIGPKIVGNAIGIDSFWVLVAVLISGSLFGFMGMLFGVPVFAVIYRYVDKLTMRSLRRKERATHTSDYFTLDQYGIRADEVDLEKVKVNEKNFLSKFKKTNTVQEEILEEIKENEAEEEREEAQREEDLEELKEKIAKELLDDK